MRHLTTEVGAHSDGIWCCAWTNDNCLVTGSVDETVKLWSVRDGQSVSPAASLSPNDFGVVSVAVTPDSSRVVSSSMDSHIRVWDVASKANVLTIDCGPVENWQVSVSADSRFVASGNQSGKVNVWDISSGEKTQIIDTGNTAMVMALAHSANGRYLVAGDRSGGVSVFDVMTMKQHTKLEGHNKTVRTVCFTSDSNTVLTGSDDGIVRVHDMRQGGNTTASCSGHTSWVLSVAAHPTENCFATGSSDNTVKFWDMGKMECTFTSSEHSNQVWGVAFATDGSLLASVSDDKSISVFSAKD